MYKVPENQNKHQPQAVGDLITQLYQTLTYGQKRRLMVQYVNLYGTRRTFFRKIKGEVRRTNSEQIFFNQYLTQNQNGNK